LRISEKENKIFIYNSNQSLQQKLLSAPSQQNSPEQQSVDVVQGSPALPQTIVAAETAVGATIEVTRGTLAAAATPSVRINARREIFPSVDGLSNGPSNRRDFASCRNASHTTCSDTGVPLSLSSCRAISAALMCPLQCFQTKAAVWFRQ
jgi:hypothetical protein